MKAINPGHFLLTCRLDNWVHLLEDNHFHIARDRLPQALYISATALALAPAAAAESLIYRKRIRETKIEKCSYFSLHEKGLLLCFSGSSLQTHPP